MPPCTPAASEEDNAIPSELRLTVAPMFAGGFQFASLSFSATRPVKKSEKHSVKISVMSGKVRLLLKRLLGYEICLHLGKRSKEESSRVYSDLDKLFN